VLVQVFDRSKYRFEAISYPTYATLTASNEPGERRVWHTKVVWDQGTHSRGELKMQSHWLSALLEQLVDFERHSLGLRINPKQRRLTPWLLRQQLRLILPADLRRSVHNAEWRWCTEKTRSRLRWLPDYPQM
jgi:hypothetical protein